MSQPMNASRRCGLFAEICDYSHGEIKKTLFLYLVFLTAAYYQNIDDGRPLLTKNEFYLRIFYKMRQHG